MKTNEVSAFLGGLVSYRDGLKLYHWHVSGEGSYAEHIAIDQAIDEINDPIDALIETSYAIIGDIDIVIPQTNRPANLIKYVEDFYAKTEEARELFAEDFRDGIIDEIQQGNQQLLYRVKRLK